MEQPTVTEIVIALVAVGSWVFSIAQYILNGKSRKSADDHNTADAIGDLTESVSKLYSRIDQLQAQLDIERTARRIAESKLADLTRRIVILEGENAALRLENEALKDALELK